MFNIQYQMNRSFKKKNSGNTCLTCVDVAHLAILLDGMLFNELENG